MAYNYFPATYQTPYQMPYQPQFQPPQAPQIPQQVQQSQPTQSGFIRVQNENEARMYPVAPGNSVAFIDENRPYCYTKTVDQSLLDRPKFEKYRLVKEEDTPNIQPTLIVEYAAKSDLEPIWAEINALKEKVAPKKVQAKKKEEEDE